ncbi:hypothetical protein AK830_g10086 [Neonectria ditissima]|uniref:Acetylxylan esterase 2 n=1 Tax=Neonectria ditissima TaxID=78410 RepID=A0A0P7B800_9HYPO|nr:hypothetical protein AK830_g10086 [Neonectria ditissima]
MYLFLTFVAVFLALVTGNNETLGHGGMKCTPGVHIIVARASLEAPGPGIMGAVAEKIINRMPGSDIVAVDYPALLDPYVPSQTAGVANMTKMVQEYAEECPRTNMVLMGYSQGAHVTADVLCGASEANFPTTKPQCSSITDKIAAVVLMGDPSFTAGQPYNLGTSKGSGIFPRQNPAGCNFVHNKMISICDAGDLFCEAGSDDLAVHMSYVANWGDLAADYVVSMYNSC